MKSAVENNNVTLEDVQLGLRELEQGTGELVYILAEIEEEAAPDMKGVAALLRMVQAAVSVQKKNVDALVARAYPGKAVGA